MGFSLNVGTLSCSLLPATEFVAGDAPSMGVVSFIFVTTLGNKSFRSPNFSQNGRAKDGLLLLGIEELSL